MATNEIRHLVNSHVNDAWQQIQDQVSLQIRNQVWVWDHFQNHPPGVIATVWAVREAVNLESL